MNILRVDSCTSTNALLSAMADAPHATVVCTRRQTAGRGQRGNSWEAEPGKNLTFSMLLRPVALHASRQFELSMVVSLAVADAIDAVLPEGVGTQIKWPNDIYVGLEKICGILIENKLSGSDIERSIAGIGINVNQRVFVSDAPNPTSVILKNGGAETDLDAMLDDLVGRIGRYWAAYETSGDAEGLRRSYMGRLMWTDGIHPFADADGAFEAHICDVAPDGMLLLSNGRRYAFKEVSYTIGRTR